MKNLQWKIVLVLAVTIIAAYGIYPPQKRIRLGLDLKGGIHLVGEVKIDEALAGFTDRFIEDLKLELQEKQITFRNVIRQGNTTFIVEGLPAEKQENFKRIMEGHGEWEAPAFTGDRALSSLRQAVFNSKSEDAVQQAIRIIRERVNKFGVEESVVQRQGLTGGRLIIQLPGVEDTDRVKKLIEGTARLELKLVVSGPSPTQDLLLVGYKGIAPPGTEILTHANVEKDGSKKTEYLLL